MHRQVWATFAVLLALLLGMAGPLWAADPMTFAEISLRVRMGESAQTIVRETTQRKLIAPLTGEQETALKKAGVADQWIAALRAESLLAAPESVAAYNQRKGINIPVVEAPVAEVPANNAPPAPEPGAAPSENQKEDGDLIKVGDLAPDFSAPALGDKHLSLHPLRGKVILLVIFAAWSEPSNRQLQAVERFIWSRFRSDGLAVIALGSGDTLAQLVECKKKNELTFDIAEDPQKAITALYATNYVPRCYVVDREGLVKYTSTGINKRNFIRMMNIVSSELKH